MLRGRAFVGSVLWRQSPWLLRRPLASHFASVTLEELRDIVQARGMRPIPGASRHELEKQLMDAPALVDDNQEVYGALLSLKQTTWKAAPEEGPRSFRFGDDEIALCRPGMDVEVTGRSGTVVANAVIDWSERRSLPVSVYVTERPEAAGVIPMTFRRRDSGTSDSGKALCGVIVDVLRAAQLSDGFPHPARVVTQSLVIRGHFNPMAHVLAACQALRMRGYPVAPVGAVRIGLMPGGAMVSDPDGEVTANAEGVASCVVALRADGEVSICYAELDGRFLPTERAQALAAHAFEAAAAQCRELARARVSWRAVAEGGATVPPDWIASFPSRAVLEAVARAARGPLGDFAGREWAGEDALAALLGSCEGQVAAVVKERATWWDLRVAIRVALAALVREQARATGLAPPRLETNRAVGGGRLVQVSHGPHGPAAAVYATLAHSHSNANMAGESCRPPSLYRDPQLTCHADLTLQLPLLMVAGDLQRGSDIATHAFALAAPWFAARPTKEGRLSVVATGTGAAWDLAASAALADVAAEPQAAPSLALWGGGRVTVRPDPLQLFCAPAAATVGATAAGRVCFVRLTAAPVWWPGGLEARPAVGLAQLNATIALGAETAAREAAQLVKPLLEAATASETLVLGRGLVKRMQKSFRFARQVRQVLAADRVVLKSDEAVEVFGGGERPADWLQQLGPSWEDFREGVPCVITNVVNFGVYVTALQGDQHLEGVSGLLHSSRAGPGGAPLTATELPHQLRENQRIRVRFLNWGDQGPVLERCASDKQ